MLCKSDGGFHQVADNGIHIPADIADFGKFCRFDFDKRSLHDLRQTAGDFRFSASGRPDHENVFRSHFFAHLIRKLISPVTVSESDGH